MRPHAIASLFDLALAAVASGLLIWGGTPPAVAVGIGAFVWILRPWPPGARGYRAEPPTLSDRVNRT